MGTLTGAEEAGGGEMVAPRLLNGHGNQTWGAQGGGRSAARKYSSLRHSGERSGLAEFFNVSQKSLLGRKKAGIFNTPKSSRGGAYNIKL